jgi:hypothetical protein
MGRGRNPSPPLLDGELCDVCELHDYSPAAMRDVPGGGRACPLCMADMYVVCRDCGELDEHDDIAALTTALTDAFEFELELPDPLCRRHLHDAYAEEWRDEHPPGSSRAVAAVA